MEEDQLLIKKQFRGLYGLDLHRPRGHISLAYILAVDLS